MTRGPRGDEIVVLMNWHAARRPDARWEAWLEPILPGDPSPALFHSVADDPDAARDAYRRALSDHMTDIQARALLDEDPSAEADLESFLERYSVRKRKDTLLPLAWPPTGDRFRAFDYLGRWD